ncbi:hypothetical protein DVA86_09585 [Streptomyces armeniacus]|uniref:Pyrrolo-quinoline quinone repeat domain-containing protein n=1 Tax=Streptomyces armeniacus TaxID=83291 RepID=A0A345XMJ7_9ACTN|nr:hypothetical protein DVA86_09585 [Streptomyces armeniacus]
MAGAVLLALLAGSACTGGGGGGEKKAEPAVPKPLRQLWDTKVTASATSRIGWLTDDTVTLHEPESGALHGYDAGSGRHRWKLTPPTGAGRVCDTSGEVNGQGVGGVVFAAGDEGECTLAAAVDSRTGRVLWSRQLGEQQGDGPNAGVSVSEKALTVTGRCDELRRMRLADGKPLPTLLPRDTDCSHDTAHNARRIAALDDPGTPEGDEREAAFVLYDPDTGKELWRRPADGRGPELGALLADDPVTLVTQDKGQRYIRTYDGNGKPVHVLGKELSNAVDEVSGQRLAAEGVLVTRFANDPRTYAYDLRTGKTLWRKALGSSTLLLGVSDGQLVTRSSLVPKGTARIQEWLIGYDLRDGTRRTLGRERKPEGAALSGAPAVHKRKLYSLVGTDSAGTYALRAYALPERGDTTDYPTQPPPGTAVKWRKGDLRPERTLLACEAVTAETREKMKLTGDRPPPDNCVWQERDQPEGSERELSVRVSTHEPGEPGSGGGSGSGGPAKTAVESARHAYDTAQYLDGAPAVRGLGEQAKGKVYSLSTHLIVRYRNVTIEVRAEGIGDRDSDRTPSRQQLKEAAHAAAADVLRRLGDKSG